ncbi:MAG: 16S rRNA (adenine(1518)-N(6)/adenine(1519)-N(6))-dimethyltransferase RsmA [Verrucomicrobiota bacterium]
MLGARDAGPGMKGEGLREYLGELGVVPSRQLGQNFLEDEAVCREIVSSLGVGPEDCVIEVGPGVGALTMPLLETGARVRAVEFDRKLAAALQERLADHPRIVVEQADAARFDVLSLFPAGPVKLLGNLPYSSGTEILRRFCDPPTPVTEAVVMLQAEVAERMQAGPGSKSYGVLSLRIQAYWEVEELLRVSPDKFFPRPQVESLVIRLRRKPAEALPPFNGPLFDRLVRRGFAQRRKQLKKQLPLEGEVEWGAVVSTLGVSSQVRGEELTLAQWVELTRQLDRIPPAGEGQSGEERFDVVDECDEVTGQATRAEVHAQGLRHRAVHLLVADPRGRVFLQKRSVLKDRHPGVWDSSAAGHVDAGESYHESASRELEEELGILGGEWEAVAKLPAEEATGWEFIQLYFLRHSGPLHWPAHEIETGAYFFPERIERWIEARPQDFAPGFLLCWSIFREKILNRSG